MVSAFELTSLAITFSALDISFATLSDLAPTPVNPSRNILGLSKFFQNAEYAKIEKSLFSLATGLKNTGSFGGTFSLIDFSVTRIFVVPSIISIIFSSVICNRFLEFFLPIMVNTQKNEKFHACLWSR